MSTNIQNPAIETLLSLTRIDPNLDIVDPQYTRNLNGYLRALQSNIDQILSIPFLQGRQGDSVLIGEFPIFSDEYEYGFDNEPNRIGFELITKLFPLADWNAPTGYIPQHPCNDDLDIFIDYYLISRRDNPDTSDTWQDIIDSVPEYAPIYDVHAWENLCPDGDYSMKVQLYYTVDYNTNDKKILGSSRYFVYYDPRLAQISGGLDADEVFRDVSAALFRESYEENNETLWHFVNKGILPTIYWSAENGYWCWSINEIDTGIRCEGIKGEDGKDGNARVVRVSTDSTTNENSGDFRGMESCIINSVFDQTTGWVSNDLGTLLEDNMVVFAIIDDVLPEDSEDPENEDPTLNPNLAFGVVFREADDSTWKCYAYTNTSLADLIRDVTLPGLLDAINKYSNSLKGLYVKDYSAYSSSSNVCHALYSDTSNTLKIAPVNWSDFKNGTVTTVDSTDSTLSLNYSTLSVPSSMTLTNSSSSSLTTINCSNLKIASGSQALTINSTSILMSSGDITISGATTIKYLDSNNQYTSKITLSDNNILLEADCKYSPSVSSSYLTRYINLNYINNNVSYIRIGVRNELDIQKDSSQISLSNTELKFTYMPGTIRSKGILINSDGIRLIGDTIINNLLHTNGIRINCSGNTPYTGNENDVVFHTGNADINNIVLTYNIQGLTPIPFKIGMFSNSLKFQNSLFPNLQLPNPSTTDEVLTRIVLTSTSNVYCGLYFKKMDFGNSDYRYVLCGEFMENANNFEDTTFSNFQFDNYINHSTQEVNNGQVINIQP